jgi:DNA uptake protein ComE-like DNA-binding protein
VLLFSPSKRDFGERRVPMQASFRQEQTIMQMFHRFRSLVLIAATVAIAGCAASAWAQTKTSNNAGKDKSAALVDLNTATTAELENVPGIGPAYAKKIIAHRPYATVNDLSKAGISAASVQKIMPLVTVKAKKPVDLNTATLAELEEVHGIGSAYAKRIIAHRPYATVNDLSKAGIPAGNLAKIMPLVTVKAKKPAAGSKSAATGAPAEASDSTAATDTDKVPPSKTGSRKRGSQSTDTAAVTPPEKGMVWVNTQSKIYHVEGDRWYGKTKNGKWMTEDDAIKAGYRKAK